MNWLLGLGALTVLALTKTSPNPSSSRSQGHSAYKFGRNGLIEFHLADGLTSLKRAIHPHEWIVESIKVVEIDEHWGMTVTVRHRRGPSNEAAFHLDFHKFETTARGGAILRFYPERRHCTRASKRTVLDVCQRQISRDLTMLDLACTEQGDFNLISNNCRHFVVRAIALALDDDRCRLLTRQSSLGVYSSLHIEYVRQSWPSSRPQRSSPWPNRTLVLKRLPPHQPICIPVLFETFPLSEHPEASRVFNNKRSTTAFLTFQSEQAAENALERFEEWAPFGTTVEKFAKRKPKFQPAYEI